MIKFYDQDGEYGYLSNFYPSRIYIDNKWYATVEHAYQAAKTYDETEIKRIRQAKTPAEAKRLGQKVELRSDWDLRKKFFMKECLIAKFTQHHELRQKLLDTGIEQLVEDSPIDYYWGCGSDGTGKNVLGKLLMEIRKELSEK